MNKINISFLIIVLLVLVVFFFYFGSGAMMNGGMNSGMSRNGSMGGNIWRWSPTLITVVFGVLIVLFLVNRKKK